MTLSLSRSNTSLIEAHMQASTIKSGNLPAYSKVEEFLNAITHFVGLVLSIIGLFTLVNKAESSIALASASIYCGTLILMFFASTSYHSVTSSKLKHYLKIVDHSAIYLLIAGTYTPLMLVVLDNAWGMVGIILIWSLAVSGVMFKIYFHGRFPKLSMATYIIMGWLAVCFIYPLSQQMDTGGLWLLFVGGLCFSVGAIFYSMKNCDYTHAIWHLFVMGGCASHFMMIYYYAV
jgi:hemolysin III